MQVDSTPSSSSYNPWNPHTSSTPLSPSSSPFQSSKRPRAVSPGPFESSSHGYNSAEPSPKRPHLPTPQQSSEEQALLFSAEALRLSSPFFNLRQQLPQSTQIDASVDDMAVDVEAGGAGLGGMHGMDGLSSLKASNREGEWSRQAQHALTSSPFTSHHPSSSSQLHNPLAHTHHSAFYPVTSAFPSQTPASTPHGSPSRIPLPLPPACQQQQQFLPSSYSHHHSRSHAHENPLSHSVQSYSNTGVGRPLQPPPPTRPGGYTMGPRADCDKCRAGVPGHYGHYPDRVAGQGAMVMH